MSSRRRMMGAKKGIDLKTAPNGVYAVLPNGKGVPVAEATPSCIAVALIVSDADTPQRIWIEKNGEANTTSIQAAYAADGATDTDYRYFNWGPYSSNVSGITDYNVGDGEYFTSDYKTWKNISGIVWNDYNGKSNTAALINEPDNDNKTRFANAATYCVKFNETTSENQGYSDWYIPSAGQMALIAINIEDINLALTKMNGTVLEYEVFDESQIPETEEYWSSSEYIRSMTIGTSTYTTIKGWAISFSHVTEEEHGYAMYLDRDGYVLVRFVRDIS